MFFKKPDIKRFHIQPRFWDPQKEEQEKREKRIRAELKEEEMAKSEDAIDEEYVPDIKGKMQKEFERRKSLRVGGGLNYSIRLFMILIFIFLVVALLFIRNKESLLHFFGM